MKSALRIKHFGTPKSPTCHKMKVNLKQEKTKSWLKKTTY